MTHSFHPLLPYLILSSLVWLTVYSVRRWLPSAWAPLTRWPSAESPASHVLQGLPSVILGAIGASLTSPGEPVWSAVYGAIAGALAPLWHHLLRALPCPYQGVLRDAVWSSSKRAEAWAKAQDAGKVGLLVLLLVGCQSTLSPAQQAERQACLAHVESEWNRRADLLCPSDSVYWDDCAHALELEHELAVQQRGCSEDVRK